MAIAVKNVASDSFMSLVVLHCISKFVTSTLSNTYIFSQTIECVSTSINCGEVRIPCTQPPINKTHR